MSIRTVLQKYMCAACEESENERCVEPLCESLDNAEEAIKTEISKRLFGE